MSVERGRFRGPRYAFRGEHLSLYQIARIVGVPVETFRRRVLKYGMTIEEAAAADRRPHPGNPPRQYWYRGQRLSIRQHAETTGQSISGLRKRIMDDRILEPAEVKQVNASFRDLPESAHLITFEGETLCIAEWARKLGFPEKVLRARIANRKWTVMRAFTTPLAPVTIRRRNHRVIACIIASVRRHRNRHLIDRISASFRGTGGYVETFASVSGTGGGRHKTHLLGGKP